MTTETTTRPDYQPYTDWHCVHHREETYAGPVLYVLVDETETTATRLCTECVQSLLLAFAAQQEAEADRRPRSFEVLTVAAYIEALRGLAADRLPLARLRGGRNGSDCALARRGVRSPLLSPGATDPRAAQVARRGRDGPRLRAPPASTASSSRPHGQETETHHAPTQSPLRLRPLRAHSRRPSTSTTATTRARSCACACGGCGYMTKHTPQRAERITEEER